MFERSQCREGTFLHFCELVLNSVLEKISTETDDYHEFLLPFQMFLQNKL